MTNYWSLGDRGFAPFVGGTNVYTFADTFDMIRGNHNIRVGVGMRFNQMNVETNGFGDGYFLMFGSYTGDAAADLLLGQIGGGIHDQTFLGATTGRRWKMFRPFVQDDWRVSNDLTVNLGLAWALVTPISEAGGRQANFNFQTGQYLVTGPLSGCTGCVASGGNVGIQFDKTAFEPRIGFAWRPLGSQTTAIRGGYAIYHDSSWNQGAQGLWQNPPYYAETDNFSGLCAFGNATSATPSNCGLQLGLLQPNTLMPFYCASRSCQLYRDYSVAKPQFQTGYGAAVQSQYRAPIARKHGVDCGLRGLEEYAHSGRWIKPERDVSPGLLPDDYGCQWQSYCDSALHPELSFGVWCV